MTKKEQALTNDATIQLQEAEKQVSEPKTPQLITRREEFLRAVAALVITPISAAGGE